MKIAFLTEMNFEGKITDKNGKEIDVDYQVVSIENSIMLLI